MQPTTRHYDGEEPQECLELDFSCDHESDVGSVESAESYIYDVEIVSDLEVDDAFDVNSEYLATKSETCDQTQVQLGSLRASSFSEQNISSQRTPQQFQIITTHICLFISFFQLCYKVSERGITLLLNFLRAILLWVSTYSAELLQLRELIPKNVYFLRKCAVHKKVYIRMWFAQNVTHYTI